MEIFEHAANVDITMILNNNQWFFEDVHPQYTIGLVVIDKRESERTPVSLRGPYRSFDRYRSGVVREPAVFHGDEIKEWNDTASLPLLPTDESVEVFVQLRKYARLDLDQGRPWRARPHREMDTNTAGIRRHRGEEGMLPRRSCADDAERLAVFADDSLEFRPGTGVAYSTYGWVLVGAVVAAA